MWVQASRLNMCFDTTDARSKLRQKHALPEFVGRVHGSGHKDGAG